MNKDAFLKAAEIARESFDALERVGTYLSLAEDARYKEWFAAVDKLRKINSEILEGESVMGEQRIMEIGREELVKQANKEAAVGATAYDVNVLAGQISDRLQHHFKGPCKTIEIRTVPVGDPNDIPMIKHTIDQIIQHLELHREAVKNLYDVLVVQGLLSEQPSGES